MGCNLPHNEGVVFTCVSQSIDARTEQKNMAADLLSLFTAAAYQHQNRFGCRRGALSSLGCVPGILESLRMEMISHFTYTTTAFPQNGVLYHVKNEAEASFFEAASGFLCVALSYYGSKKMGKYKVRIFKGIYVGKSQTSNVWILCGSTIDLSNMIYSPYIYQVIASRLANFKKSQCLKSIQKSLILHYCERSELSLFCQNSTLFCHLSNAKQYSTNSAILSNY